jgi:hypothetical protein
MDLKLTESDVVIAPVTFRYVLIYISINPRHLAVTTRRACEFVDGDECVG